MAEIEIEELVDGQLHSRSMLIDGSLAADDRFDVGLTRHVLGADGEPALLNERYAYDGDSLRYAFGGAPRHHFYCADHPGLRSRFQTSLQPLLALGQWVKDPLAWDRLADLEVVVDVPDSNGLVAVHQDWSPVLPTGGRVSHWFEPERG